MLDDIEPETRTMSRSALRYRPIAPDARHTQVSTPRASRLRMRQKPKPYSPDDLAFESPSPTHVPKRIPKASRAWLYLVLGMLIAILLLWVGQALWNWGNTTIDDIRYGRPRTTNVDRRVGHELGAMPSHFTALNLSGQIYIIEIPGGQPNNSHLLIGPHLIGQGTDLAPVSLSFPGDPQHPDLLVSVAGVQTLFHNTGSAYVPAVDDK